MGCDIHAFAEVKKEGKWEMVKNHFTMSEWEQNDRGTEKSTEVFSFRNYLLFGILAGVRNKTCTPISVPKKLPKDISNEVFKEYLTWSIDAHSASYLTLKELLEHDYPKGFEKEITPLFFTNLEELKELGEPENVRIVFWFDN